MPPRKSQSVNSTSCLGQTVKWILGSLCFSTGEPNAARTARERKHVQIKISPCSGINGIIRQLPGEVVWFGLRQKLKDAFSLRDHLQRNLVWLAVGPHHPGRVEDAQKSSRAAGTRRPEGLQTNKQHILNQHSLMPVCTPDFQELLVNVNFKQLFSDSSSPQSGCPQLWPLAASFLPVQTSWRNVPLDALR